MGTMQAPEAYIAELLAALEPLPAVVLPLAEAHGLVLAEDAAAALPVPPWTNSVMDGCAVRATPISRKYRKFNMDLINLYVIILG